MKKGKSIFKRWWFWLIVVVIIGGAAASGSKDEAKKVDNSSSSSQEQVNDNNKSKTFKIGDTIEVKDFKVKVNKVSTSNGTEFIQPKKGNEFLKVDVTVENITKETQSVSSVMMFKVVNKDGRAFDQSITDDQKGQLDGEVGPGRKISGEYIVEVPKGQKGLELEFDSSLLSGGQIVVELN